METKVAIKCNDALVQAWELMNSQPKGEYPVELAARLTYHAQQLMPGPYTVVIEHRLENVSDNPKIFLTLMFDENASKEEVLLFRLRHL